MEGEKNDRGKRDHMLRHYSMVPTVLFQEVEGKQEDTDGITIHNCVFACFRQVV